MIINRKIITTVLALLFIGVADAAVSYRTTELRRLAHVVGVEEGSLHPGYNYIKGCTVKLDDDMTVRHVGLTLFTEEVKNMGNCLILEFVERYFLQLSHPAPSSTSALMIKSDGITFPQGRWQDIKNIKKDTPFKLDYKLMRYTLSWKGTKQSLAFSFPGKYQLICGENLPQAEENLLHDITHIDKVHHPAVTLSQMQPSSRKGYYIKKGAWFYDESITSSTYYEKTNGTLTPLIDTDLIKESVANMMICANAAEPFALDITMHRYGFKDTQFSIPLQKWIDYCFIMGCEIFCGIESIKSEEVKATVIAVNQKLNFNHLLSVTVPIKTIENKKGPVIAELNAFIPTHNIININGKYKKANKSKNITF